jgi:hypothetical protein
MQNIKHRDKLACNEGDFLDRTLVGENFTRGKEIIKRIGPLQMLPNVTGEKKPQILLFENRLKENGCKVCYYCNCFHKFFCMARRKQHE